MDPAIFFFVMPVAIFIFVQQFLPVKMLLCRLLLAAPSSSWWIVMHSYLRDSEEIGFAHWQAARMRIWGQFSKAYSTWVRKLGKFANFPQSIQSTPLSPFHSFDNLFTARSCLPYHYRYYGDTSPTQNLYKHVFSAWNWVIVLRVYDGSVLSQEVLTYRLCKLIPGLTGLVPEARLE